MRCNIINPWFLADQHLMAERRELRMIPPLVRKRIANKTFANNIPAKYTLGAGHMLFWVPRLKYLETRFEQLTDEMLKRGFKPDLSLKFDIDESFIQHGFYNDWEPEPDDYDIIIQRLRERIMKQFGWYRYCGKPLPQHWLDVTYPPP
jgi:deoxyribonuclease (pyrimidine dimer)